MSTAGQLSNLSLHADAASGPKKTRTNLGARSRRHIETISDIVLALRADPSSVTIGVNGRSLPPSTLTTHSCGALLRHNIIASTYYRKTGAPSQPNEHTQENNCRFDASWSNCTGPMVATSILKMVRPSYSGYFIALAQTYLPTATDPDWCVGAGMYPTDLSIDCHEYREIWPTLHLSVRPQNRGAKPAIGVFLHCGRRYTLRINGTDRMIQA